MSSQSYQRLEIEEFGRQLLATEDLDPVYIMLHKAQLSEPQLSRWLLAYWCFYHCGVACKLSEMKAPEFWEHMRIAAKNSPNQWPRSAERRHFRAQNAIDGVSDLHQRFADPIRLLPYLRQYRSFSELNAAIQTWVQFGPWISFKVCDMAQAVLGLELDLTGANLSVYAEPVKGAQMWCERNLPSEPILNQRQQLDKALGHLAEHLGDRLAPPQKQRKLNIFEYETVLCKWKSHVKGHYEVGHDTHEIRNGLCGWGELAQRMVSYLPSSGATCL
jgi:hypothetical protein